MPLSQIVVALENGLQSILATNNTSINFSKPQYSVTRLGPGQYDVLLSLSGFGVQHFSITLEQENFSITGKILVIGDNPSFPFALIANMLNSIVQKWVENGVDALVTAPPTPIANASIASTTIPPRPLMKQAYIRKS